MTPIWCGSSSRYFSNIDGLCFTPKGDLYIDDISISRSSKEETVQDSVKEFEGNRYSLKELVHDWLSSIFVV